MSIHRKDRVIVAFAAMMLTALISPTALSEGYKVSQFRYTNKGEYEACPEVHWTDASGRRQVSRLDYCVKRGKSTTLNLGELKNPPAPGSEVWMQVRIVFGEVESCRTNEATFQFDPGGKRVKFRTGGTTLDRNQCKLKCRKCSKSK